MPWACLTPPFWLPSCWIDRRCVPWACLHRPMLVLLMLIDVVCLGPVSPACPSIAWVGCLLLACGHGSLFPARIFFGLVVVVCLGPDSLFPGWLSCGWFVMLCLVLSSAPLGCLLDRLIVLLYMCVSWGLTVALVGFSLYLPHTCRLSNCNTPPMV